MSKIKINFSGFMKFSVVYQFFFSVQSAKSSPELPR